METILDYVKRRLADFHSSEWESIGLQANATKSLPRKLMYERTNPGVNRVEPLYRYFIKLDTGSSRLPHERNGRNGSVDGKRGA